MGKKKKRRRNLPQKQSQHDLNAGLGAPVLVEHTTTKAHSGPIPSPEVLAAYNEIIPNGAERIMSMAEAQSAHRQDIEKRAFEIARENSQADSSVIRRGQYFALVAVMTSLIVAGFLSYNGHDIAGSIMGSAGLASLAAAFIWGKPNPSSGDDREMTSTTQS